MFTGLVEEIGKVLEIRDGGSSLRIKIAARLVLGGARVGDSIATNGVCLTAVEVGNGYFVADAMPETYRRTNLKKLKVGSKVNLEKSLTLSSLLGGHLVTGDVDCEAMIKTVYKEGIAIIYEIEVENKYMKYVVEKGRVTIDGASLSIMDFTETSLKVSLIPHSQEMITLGEKKQGDSVNIEMDLIGKYVERMLNFKGEEPESKLSKSFLMENGFM